MSILYHPDVDLLSSGDTAELFVASGGLEPPLARSVLRNRTGTSSEIVPEQ